MDLKKEHYKRLLRFYSSVLDELKARGIIRSRNNPVSDYAEWLTSKKLSLQLEGNSNVGYDARDKKGVRYQIKSRRVHPNNNSRQLGVIRDLNKKQFDYLIGIVFDNDFDVKGAYIIPHGIIKEYARFSKHQNGHILQLKGAILDDKRTKDVTRHFF